MQHGSSVRHSHRNNPRILSGAYFGQTYCRDTILDQLWLHRSASKRYDYEIGLADVLTMKRCMQFATKPYRSDLMDPIRLVAVLGHFSRLKKMYNLALFLA